jgi:hypothetical protein
MFPSPVHPDKINQNQKILNPSTLIPRGTSILLRIRHPNAARTPPNIPNHQSQTIKSILPAHACPPGAPAFRRVARTARFSGQQRFLGSALEQCSIRVDIYWAKFGFRNAILTIPANNSKRFGKLLQLFFRRRGRAGWAEALKSGDFRGVWIEK